MRQLLIWAFGALCFFVLTKVTYDWLEARARRKKNGGKNH